MRNWSHLLGTVIGKTFCHWCFKPVLGCSKFALHKRFLCMNCVIYTVFLVIYHCLQLFIKLHELCCLFYLNLKKLFDIKLFWKNLMVHSLLDRMKFIQIGWGREYKMTICKHHECIYMTYTYTIPLLQVDHLGHSKHQSHCLVCVLWI